MTTNQIKATELVKQINETAEKLSSLIKSDFENLQGFTITQVTSSVDEENRLDVNFIAGGHCFDLVDVHLKLMNNNEDYLTIMNRTREKYEEQF